MTAIRPYLAALVAVAGCGLDDGPAEPTWAADVKPILDANCVRCHSYPPIGGAPATFRLDTYDPFELPDGSDVIPGAADTERLFNLSAIVAGELMPPPEAGRQPLTDRQKGILERWGDNDAPRGEAPAGNRAPGFELRRPLADSIEGANLVVQYEIRDPDRDLVTGQILARPQSGADDVRAGYVRSGRGEVVWDISALTEDHELILLLDDGDLHESSIGTVEASP